jgi:predicted phage terminase large subunit-like protein
VRYETSTGSKEVRAMPFAAQCEAGNVKLLRGPWNVAYLDELTSFPFGTNDDQVDASSGGFNKLAKARRPLVGTA